MKILVLGGVRSGKSRHAESLVNKLAVETKGSEVVYIATAQSKIQFSW